MPAAAEDVTGEVRSALAPSKPQRTASMRDRVVVQPVPRRTHGDDVTSVQGMNQHRDYDVGLAAVRSTSDSPVRGESSCSSISPRFLAPDDRVYRTIFFIGFSVARQFEVDFSIIFSHFFYPQIKILSK